MKKRLFTILLCIMLCFCVPCFFTGCNDQNYSPEDFDALYTSMKTDIYTGQFFEGDKLTVNFDSTKIKLHDTNDKSYIFPLVYDYYLKSSSRLFSVVISRLDTPPSFVIKYFSQPQINSLYESLLRVKNNLNAMAKSKVVFEESNGNLYYKNILSDYNNLISSLYDFNSAFASYYFSSVGYVDFATANLTDSNIRDMLSYQLMLISKVSYNYEILSFKISNPLGEINTWYKSTTQVQNFTNLARDILLRIDTTGNNLADNFDETKQEIKQLFLLIQANANKYDSEYNKFIMALQNVNVKAYLSATNKVAYLETCSAKEQSCFNIIQNFLNGRYSSVMQGLNKVVTNLKV